MAATAWLGWQVRVGRVGNLEAVGAEPAEEPVLLHGMRRPDQPDRRQPARNTIARHTIRDVQHRRQGAAALDLGDGEVHGVGGDDEEVRAREVGLDHVREPHRHLRVVVRLLRHGQPRHVLLEVGGVEQHL